MEKNKKEEKIDKILWLDLEMSGLNIDTDRILEVASVVTDLNLKEQSSFESVVYQSDRVLASMNEWCQEQHSKSGLVEAVKKAPQEDEVEKNFLQFLQKEFSKEDKIVLAGNSIFQDRKFIDKYWKSISSLLHYRMIDVSSWKVLFENKYAKSFSKKDKHRAIADIRASIAELEFYLTFVALN